jgi:hypothetical protein
MSQVSEVEGAPSRRGSERQAFETNGTESK